MSLIFGNISRKDFEEKYSNASSCLAFLADSKWKNGFVCRKCGNTNFCHGKTPYSRRCTRCKTDESATAHTVFHNCRLPLPEAFRILFAICCQPDISSYKIARQENIRKMTCWKLRKKIEDCMAKNKGIVDAAK